MITPTQPRPLLQTLLAAAAVMSFALLGALIVYFLTEALLLLRSHARAAIVATACFQMLMANYCFPKRRPSDRERARIIGNRWQPEAQFLA